MNDEWKNAIIDGLVVAGIYSKRHDSDPRQALNELIDWHCQVVLDPHISSDAEKLIQEGVLKERTECLKDCLQEFGQNQTGQNIMLRILNRATNG